MTQITSLSEKIKTEGDRVLNIFTGFSDEQWNLEVYTENTIWTVRDILSHFVSSERGLLLLFDQIRSGAVGVSEDFSIDRFNASQQLKLKDSNSPELLEQYRVVRANSVSWVSSLNDSDLEITGRHPFLGQTTLREMIKMLYLHNQIHIRDIKKAIDHQELVDKSRAE